MLDIKTDMLDITTDMLDKTMCKTMWTAEYCPAATGAAVQAATPHAGTGAANARAPSCAGNVPAPQTPQLV